MAGDEAAILHHASDSMCGALQADHWHYVGDAEVCVNLSSQDNRTEACRYCVQNLFYIRVEVLLQTALLAVSVIGNCIVLTSMWAQFRHRTVGRSEIFITNLCVADLLVAFGGILSNLIEKLTLSFVGPPWLCKLMRYLQVVSFAASTFSIVTMAIDRYIAIVHPMTMYGASSKIVYSLIIVPWVLALMLCVPQLFFFDIGELPVCRIRGCFDTYGNYTKWLEVTYISLYFFMVYLVPAVVLLVSYTLLSLAVWRTVYLREKGLMSGVGHRSLSREEKESSLMPSAVPPCTVEMSVSHSRNGNLASETSTKQGVHEESFISRDQRATKVTVRSNAHSRMRFRAVAMTATIVVVFVLSWAPFAITQMWMLYDAASAPKQKAVFIIGTSLAYFSSCFNPWIFLAFNARRVYMAISRRTTWRNTTGSVNK